jgi:hypothetical protein
MRAQQRLDRQVYTVNVDNPATILPERFRQGHDHVTAVPRAAARCGRCDDKSTVAVIQVRERVLLVDGEGCQQRHHLAAEQGLCRCASGHCAQTGVQVKADLPQGSGRGFQRFQLLVTQLFHALVHPL